MANETALYAVMNAIEADEKKWNQTKWGQQTEECGTQFCFAGMACFLAGCEMEWEKQEEQSSYYYTGRGTGRGENVYYLHSVDDQQDPQSKAVELLDLTPYEADFLFLYMDNNVEEMKARVKKVAAGEIPNDESYWEMKD